MAVVYCLVGGIGFIVSVLTLVFLLVGVEIVFETLAISEALRDKVYFSLLFIGSSIVSYILGKFIIVSLLGR
jgi:hypothetical protein